MPADFALRLEYDLCVTQVLDTFKGVFVRHMGADAPPVSIPLTMSVETLRAMHQAVMAAQFFDYPARFRIMGSTGFAPSMIYRLQVRSGGREHSVEWRDSIRPSTPEADRLRAMFDSLIRVITEQPDVKRLPWAPMGCA